MLLYDINEDYVLKEIYTLEQYLSGSFQMTSSPDSEVLYIFYQSTFNAKQIPKNCLVTYNGLSERGLGQAIKKSLDKLYFSSFVKNFSVADGFNKILYLSEDNTVQLIDFANNKPLTKKMFSQIQVTSAAMDPSGFLVVLSSPDFLRAYFVFNQDFQIIHNINLKQISLMNFSMRGDLLAVISGKVLHLFDPYDFSTIKLVQLDSYNIKSFKWILNDYQFITSSFQSYAYRWSTTSVEKVKDIFIPDKSD